MDSLDCPDASLLTPRRNTTLTALQALSLLNDPFVLRQCERLAERLTRDRPDDVRGQIDRLYRLALGRPPAADEASMLLQQAARHGLPSACRLLLNSNEFVFVD